MSGRNDALWRWSANEIAAASPEKDAASGCPRRRAHVRHPDAPRRRHGRRPHHHSGAGPRACPRCRRGPDSGRWLRARDIQPYAPGPVPAAEAALRAAGLTFAQLDAVTTHNPFAVNDIYFARETGFPLERMNSYRRSLIFGHPQGPTRLRSATGLIEELRQRGGGTGLLTGCAAGDTGAALVLRVDD